MRKYYYDLHIHSCLSPCGDDDNTPNNLAGMASICGLDIIALTDHNSALNCPAFFDAAQRYGITPVAGMELTTSEDIHVVCLFEELNDALEFDDFISERRIKIKNRPEIFGRQLVLDSSDNVIREVDHLLTNATDISIDEVCDIVKTFNGVCYPAHIDRGSNGIISILGAIPPDHEFDLFEIKDEESIDKLCNTHGISKERVIVSSDAHYLENINDAKNYFTFEEQGSPDDVRRELFKLLRKQL